MCDSFISKVKQNFQNDSGRSGCFEFLFWFNSAILLSRMKSPCKSLPNSSCYFWIHKSVLHQSSVPSNTTPLYFFTSNIIYFGQKQLTKEQVFEIFECSGQNSLNSSFQFWTKKSIPLQILDHSSLSWSTTPL